MVEGNEKPWRNILHGFCFYAPNRIRTGTHKVLETPALNRYAIGAYVILSFLKTFPESIHAMAVN